MKRPFPALGGLLVALVSGACVPAAPAAAPFPPPSAAAPPEATTLAPGVRHWATHDPGGPWAIQVVEVEPDACAVLRTVKANDRLEGRETTSALAARAERRWGGRAVAAVNADFFRFTPPGVPVGAQVSDGEIVHGPTDRDVFGVTADGVSFFARVHLAGEVRTRAGFAAPIRGVNGSDPGEGLTLFNRYVGERTPADTGVVQLTVRVLDGGRFAGDTVRAVVARLDTLPAAVPVGDGGSAVLAGRGAGAAFLRTAVSPGDTVVWWLPFAAAPGPVREMVGGFPRLLAGGEPVHARDPAVSAPFGEARHPRTAVGRRPDGTLLLVTVDGRQPDHSAGMSLQELADLLLRLGATEALNLDGGGSTAMVVLGEVVNRPSDREGERANANALVLLAPPAESPDARCPR